MAKSSPKKKKAAKKDPKPTAAPQFTAAKSEPWDVLLEEQMPGTENLSQHDREVLQRSVRFLYTVVDEKFLRRAVQNGYSQPEHEHLWTLFETAAGRKRPLAVSLSAFANGDPKRQSTLADVDAFENRWLPRAEAIIRRVAPREQAEDFVAKFFDGLKQQPLGPLVIDSVSTFLDRVEALEKSSWPGAQEVLATLEQRGLDEDAVADIRSKLELLRKGAPIMVQPKSTPSPKAAEDEQLKAMVELRLAWNDWATTLRPLYDVREQIQLGLTEVKVRAEATAPVPTPVVEAPVPATAAAPAQ